MPICHNRIVCYTAITGSYDSVHEPTFATSGVDYICFTDSAPSTRSMWQFRPIPKDLTMLSAVKQQRILKICPHRYLGEYDISIWIDGNIKVKGDLNKLLSEYDLEKCPLYTRVHPSRDCVYEEAKAIIAAGKDSEDVILPITKRYEAEGYPRHIGMAETNILLRRHHDIKCVMMCDKWATELLLNSHRDQMSFNYAAWKMKFAPGYMVNQFAVSESEYFTLMKHGK